MIRAIIFDCFGVLASDGWLPYKAKYFGSDPALMEQVSELSRAVDGGRISFDEFMSEVARLADLPERAARQQIENNIPDEKLFAQITALKPNYKIGMLSNAGDNWLTEIFTPEQVALFDAVALSYQIGSIKPELGAYQTIAERLGVLPQECVFIDDQPKYIEGAVQAGMQTILYTNVQQFERDLPALLQNH